MEPWAFQPLAQRLTRLELRVHGSTPSAADVRGVGPAVAELACLKELHIRGVRPHSARLLEPWRLPVRSEDVCVMDASCTGCVQAQHLKQADQ